MSKRNPALPTTSPQSAVRIGLTLVQEPNQEQEPKWVTQAIKDHGSEIEVPSYLNDFIGVCFDQNEDMPTHEDFALGCLANEILRQLPNITGKRRELLEWQMRRAGMTPTVTP